MVFIFTHNLKIEENLSLTPRSTTDDSVNTIRCVPFHYVHVLISLYIVVL